MILSHLFRATLVVQPFIVRIIIILTHLSGIRHPELRCSVLVALRNFSSQLHARNLNCLYMRYSCCAENMEESLHKLADLTEATKFEGYKKPPTASTEPEKPAPEPFLRHRLRSRLPFWRSVCSSSFVIGIITVGFMLPWAAGGSPPAPWASANHASAFEHAEFVDTAVASLVTTGAVMRVSKAPFLVSPLGVVPKAENKLRLILDLRYLNQFLELTKFKYESIKSVPDLCAPSDFLFTVDLKSGYHHIDMYQEHWQYLDFQWRDQYYVFTQLPFGLVPACYVFTKVMRQLVKS